MKILMFGKSGQVALEVLRNAGGHQIRALGRAEADLGRPAECAAAVLSCDAELVLNTAAYTAVDRAESEPELATLINATSPGAIATACSARNLPIIHISTDYVFDGTSTIPWRVSDPVNPLNVYGETKLQGEQAIVASGARYLILRTSWVFSAHGSNFVRTMLRLAVERESFGVVEDQFGGPTPAADIARTLLRMAQATTPATPRSGIYHYAGSPDTSWKEFAVEILTQSGLKAGISGIPTSAFPTPARRPSNSRLDCARILADFGVERPDWKKGLASVLQELGARI